MHAGETSTRAALVSELVQEDRLHLARCGILGKPFVDALETSGVPRDCGDDGAKIRKEVETLVPLRCGTPSTAQYTTNTTRLGQTW